MPSLKIGLIAAAVAIVLTSVWEFHAQQVRQNEILRLRKENDQFRTETNARRTPSDLRSNTQTEKAFGQNRPSGDGEPGEMSFLPPPSEPDASYRNEGMATPLNTLNTLAWACARGDLAMTEQLLTYDAEAREKAVRHFAAHPGEVPTEWPSVEAAAAALYVDDGMRHPYPTTRILALAKFEPIGSSRVLLHLPGANGDGYEFERTPEGWKLVVTMKVVDDYIAEAAKNRKPR